MGLMHRSGSATSLSEPSENKLTEKVITESNKDTFYNRTAISPSRYNLIYDSLLKYAAGIPVTVEYFKNNYDNILKQTSNITFSLERSDVEFSYTVIHNLEIKLKDALTSEFDPDSSEFNIEGTALIYPGIEPKNGDLFFLNLGENQVGVFVVDNVIKLSIYQGSYYEISFHIYSLLDDEIKKKIYNNIDEELYFDKQKYLTHEITLLKSEDFCLLEELKKKEKSYVSTYMNNFYDRQYGSLTYYDEEIEKYVYDPFLVDFWQKTCSIREFKKFDIFQLSPTFLKAMKNDLLWNRLIDLDNSPIKKKYHTYVTINYRVTDAFITSDSDLILILPTEFNQINSSLKDFVLINSVIEKFNYYILNSDFYDFLELDTEDLMNDEYINDNFVDYDLFELFLARYIHSGNLNSQSFYESFIKDNKTYKEETKENFYKLPLLIYLIRLAINELK